MMNKLRKRLKVIQDNWHKSKKPMDLLDLLEEVYFVGKKDQAQLDRELYGVSFESISSKKDYIDEISKLFQEIGNWYHNRISDFPKGSFLTGYESYKRANAILVIDTSKVFTLFMLLLNVINDKKEKDIIKDKCIDDFRSELNRSGALKPQ